MALQVWLPLIKDTNNYGSSSTSGSLTHSSISYADGKLGKAIRIANYITTTATYPGIVDKTVWSICCWLKLSSSDTFTNYTDFFTIGMNNDGQTGGGFRIEHTSAAGGIQIPVPKLTTIGNTNSWYTVYSNGTCCKDQWAHFAIVCNGTNYYIYLNGALTSTVAISNFTTTTSKLTGTVILGMSGSYCWLNDLRIYDHALSLKEVKEINKGLVAHYPLNNRGFGFINPNLIKNTANGTNWSYSTFNKQEKTFTRSTTATTESYIMGRTDLNNTKTYTMSAEIMTNGQVNSVELFAYDNTIKDIKNKNVGAPTTWTKVFLTFTPSSSYDWTNCVIRFDNNGSKTSGTEAILYVKNIKVEEGSSVTPWCPHTADPEYGYMGYNSTREVDISGYGNHGTFSSNAPVMSNDSPKYDCCMQFNGTNNFITCGRGGMVTDSITISMWCYASDWGNHSGSIKMISCTESGGWNIYSRSDNKINFDIGTGTSSNTYKSVTSASAITGSGWHMFTTTYDGLSIKIYIDGVLNNTATPYSTKTPIFYNSNNAIFLAAEAGPNITTPTGEYFNGKISDVRIYSTALSADDIKELYQIPASIDNTGTIYSLDFNEN